MPTEKEQTVARLLAANRILDRYGCTPLYRSWELDTLTFDELVWAADSTVRLAAAVAYAMRGTP